MGLVAILRKAISIQSNIQHHEHITALRGISILAIIMLHFHAMGSSFKMGPDFKIGHQTALYISYLSMGAPFFLLLSAYSLCLSSFNKTNINRTSFYIRRFFRIAPLFYFMTLVVILWQLSSGITIYPLINKSTILCNFLFIFNFMPQHGCFRGIVGASWFIGVIMPFYVIFTLIYKPSKKVSTVMWFFIISLIVSYLFRLSLHWMQGMEQQFHMLPGDMEWYGLLSLISNLPYFLMGIIVYHISRMFDNYQNNRMLGGILLVLSVIALIGLPQMSDQYLVNPVPIRYIIGLLFIPLTLSLAIHENRLIINGFTIYMGRISYSLFLVHTFVIQRIIPLYDKLYVVLKSDWLAFICCYTMTVLVVTLISLLTYKLIELPGARLGDLFERKLRFLFPSTFKLKIETDKLDHY